MKDLTAHVSTKDSDTLTEILVMVEELLDGGFTASAVGNSIFTEAANLPSLRDNVREAVRCHFENDKMPRIIRLRIVREEVLSASG